MLSLGQAFVEIKSDISGFLKDLHKVEQGVEDVGKASGKAAMSFGQLVKAGAGLGIGFELATRATFAIQGFANGIIGAGIQLSMLKTSTMQTMTVMTGSIDEASKAWDRMEEFAAKTPFQLKELTSQMPALLRLGFSVEELIPAMNALGNATKGTGANMEGVTRALTQMAMKGKVSGEEMLQLAENNIGAWQILADKLGVDIPTAMKLAEYGMIDGLTGAKLLLAGMGEQFDGLMEKSSHTFEGLKSTIEDTWDSIRLTLMEPVVEVLTEKMQLLVDFLESDTFESALDGFAEMWGQAFRKIMAFMEDAARVLVPRAWEMFIAVIDGAAMGMNALHNMIVFVEDAARVVIGALGAMADKGADWLDFWSDVGSDMVDVFIEIADGMADLVTVFAEALTGIIEVVAAGVMVVYDLLSYLNPFATHSPSLVSQVEEGTDAIADEYSDLADDVIPDLEDMSDAVGDLADANAELGDSADTIGELAENTMDLATATQSLADTETALADLTATIEEMEIAYEQLGDAIDESKDKIAAYKDEIKAAQDAIDQLLDTKTGEEIAYEDSAKAIQTEIDQNKLKIVQLKQLGPLEEEVIVRDEKGRERKVKRNTALGDEVDAIQKIIDKLELEKDELDLKKKLNIDPAREALEELGEAAKRGLDDADRVAEGPAATFADLAAAIKDYGERIGDLMPKLETEEDTLAGMESAYKLLGLAIRDAKRDQDELNDSVRELRKLVDELTPEGEKTGGGGGGSKKKGVKEAYADLWAEIVASGRLEGATDLGTAEDILNAGSIPDGVMPFVEKWKRDRQMEDILATVRLKFDELADSMSNLRDQASKLKDDLTPTVDLFVDTVKVLDELIPLRQIILGIVGAWVVWNGTIVAFNVVSSLSAPLIMMWKLFFSAKLITSIDATTKAVQKLTIAQWLWNGAVVAFNYIVGLGAIGLLILAIAALVIVVAGIITYFGWWDEIWAALNVAGEWFNKNVLEPSIPLLQQVGEFAAQVGGALAGIAQAVWDFLQPAFEWIKDHWELLTLILLAPIILVVAPIALIFGAIFHLFEDLWSWVSTWIDDAWSLLSSLLIGGAKGAVEWFEKSWTIVKTFLVDPLIWIIGWVKDNWETVLLIMLTGPLGLVLGWLDDKFDILDKLKGIFTGVLDWFRDNWVTTLMGQLVGPLWDVIVWIDETFHLDLVDKLVGAFTAVKDVLLGLGEGGLSSLTDGVVGMFSNMIDAIGDQFGRLWTNVIRPPLQYALDGIRDFVNAFIRAINWVGEKLGASALPLWGGFVLPGGAAGVSTDSAAARVTGSGRGLIQLASGTSNWRGGWAMVGELGRELVWLPPGAKVLPNHVTDSAMRQLGGLGDAIIPQFGFGLPGGDMLGDVIGGAAGAAADAVGAAAGMLLNGPEWLVSHALSLFGVSTPDLGGLGHYISPGLIFSRLKNNAVSWATGLWPFHHGGVVTEPTAGMVGEAGPEAIIPLYKFPFLASLFGFGGNLGNDMINRSIDDQPRWRSWADWAGNHAPGGAQVTINGPVFARDVGEARRSAFELIWHIINGGSTEVPYGNDMVNVARSTGAI